MNKKIISYDLGTSGNKASLFDSQGNCLYSVFISYPTHYPQVGWHEQSPIDWWNSVVESTQRLLAISNENKENIDCIGISGHSLGAVPIDKSGRLLRDRTPIWSDNRAKREANEFFTKINYDDWYMTTGNGFPEYLYTIFKIMWYKNNEPEMYKSIDKIIGTKDFINYKLTGVIKTDHSYASGSGIYILNEGDYHTDFLNASGIPRELFPDIVPSTHILSEIKPEIANLLGLSPKVKVVCGGVDNSCMALGAGNIKSGSIYTSLGSSAWVATSSYEPVLNLRAKPYVFAHVVPKMYTSAVSIFSAGTTFNWVKEQMCQDLVIKADQRNKSIYTMMNELAEKVPVGSNKLLFNPSLAGGTSLDDSKNIRGAYMGLDFKHGRPELIRACMEGIVMNLKLNFNFLSQKNTFNEMLLLGGGSKSKLYRKIFANVFNLKIITTNINQEAGALGSAAIAAVGCGLWDDFNVIEKIHKVTDISQPEKEISRQYEKLLPIFEFASKKQAHISDKLANL